MSLLSRAVMRIPAVRRLEQERDAFRGERDSMRLKVQAISAKMGILEEEGRVLVREVGRQAEQAKSQAAEHDRLSAKLAETLVAHDAVTAEHEKLKADHDAILQRMAVVDGVEKNARGLGALHGDAAVELVKATTSPTLPLPESSAHNP